MYRNVLNTLLISSTLSIEARSILRTGGAGVNLVEGRQVEKSALNADAQNEYGKSRTLIGTMTSLDSKW